LRIALFLALIRDSASALTILLERPALRSIAPKAYATTRFDRSRVLLKK